MDVKFGRNGVARSRETEFVRNCTPRWRSGFKLEKEVPCKSSFRYGFGIEHEIQLLRMHAYAQHKNRHRTANEKRGESKEDNEQRQWKR